MNTKAPKQNTVLETTRTKAILKYINGLPGFIAVKRHQAGYNCKGDPDITGCGPRGRRLEIEVKQPGAAPTRLQEERLRVWSSYGAVTGIVHDVPETRDLLVVHGLLQ
jgi:hypothetical protein